MKKMIYKNSIISGCFFRSTVQKPNLKILLQITERCNMSCIHCFNASNCEGEDIKLNKLKEVIIPKLLKAGVTRVTLTGGEPMLHPEIYEIINIFKEFNIHITICTNGLLFDEELIKNIAELGNTHINVSLDGFSVESHCKFRGIKKENYSKILNNIVLMGKNRILNGIMCSPNKYSNDNEYIELCKFAKDNNASYVLFNPLSKFGRGNKTQSYAYTKVNLQNLREKIENANIENDKFEVVFIRIPKSTVYKNYACECNYEIPYIFTNGDVAVCPYMIFATESETSKYKKEDFLYGNIYDEMFDLKNEIVNYNKIKKEGAKKRGCIASKITNGLYIDDYDPEIYEE